jgi:hypothetical protein
MRNSGLLRVRILEPIISLRGTGDIYERNMTRDISLYFSNYTKMADLNDYLQIRGNIKHSWEVHKRVMREK